MCKDNRHRGRGLGEGTKVIDNLEDIIWGEDVGAINTQNVATLKLVVEGLSSVVTETTGAGNVVGKGT